jgi:hypothetical protein
LQEFLPSVFSLQSINLKEQPSMFRKKIGVRGYTSVGKKDFPAVLAFRGSSGILNVKELLTRRDSHATGKILVHSGRGRIKVRCRKKPDP